jgi:hypothetical protein
VDPGTFPWSVPRLHHQQQIEVLINRRFISDRQTRIAPGRQTDRDFSLRGFSRSRQEAHAGVVWHPNEASHSAAKGQHVEDDV